MLEDLIKKCSETIDCITSPIKKVGANIQTGFDTVDRKIVEMTAILPQDVRNVARESYWSLPYAVPLCSFIPPGLGILAAGTAVVAVKVFEKRNVMSPETAQQMYLGIRTFCAIGATVDVVRAGVTANPVLLISVPFYILFGVMAHENAQDLNGRRLGSV